MSRVSVIMPVCNAENVVKTAVESILAQSLSDFEFIIVDDGSTDQTVKVIRSFKDNRIRLVCQSQKKGVAATLNTGLRQTTSPYIARMDADDIAHKDRLAIQINYLDRHHDIGVVCSWVKIIDKEGKETGCLHYPTSDKRLKRLLFRRNCIIHPTVVVRKAFLMQYGGYDEDLEGAEDYDLWLRLALHTRFHTVSRELLWYRLSSGSVSYQENRRILTMTVKAKIKAMREYGYSWLNVCMLIQPLLSLTVPDQIRLFYYRNFVGYA